MQELFTTLPDVLILFYVILLIILIYQAEKYPENALKIVLVGLFFTPFLGFTALHYLKNKNH